MVNAVYGAAAAMLLLASAEAQSCAGGYFEVTQEVNTVTSTCGSGPPSAAGISLPSTCSSACASVFNNWYMNGNGPCFLALNLPSTMSSTFASFSSLCAASGGGMCPHTPPVCSGGEPVDNRFVLVDQPMTWQQAKQYCQSRYRDLASIHSDDESDIAFSVCEASQTMNTCVDRFVDAGTCTGAAGCWIGLHQQVGQRYSTDEVTAFDNTGQCHVDHRISDALYDIPLDKIRVVTQDGTAKEWNMKGNPTLRSLLLGPWHGVAGENDRYKFLAGSREGNVNDNLYLFADGDIAADAVGCPASATSGRGPQNGPQDSCPGTPVGLISLNPRGAGVTVPGDAGPADKQGNTLVADYGECNYNPSYGFVVQSMFITPADAKDVWEEKFQWSDGSSVDFGNWFVDEPNGAGGTEDEVEMRMACDGYACFHGQWNDNSGATVRQPFLCEKSPPKYTMVDIPMSWGAAQQHCRTFFNDLASIHSDKDHEQAVNACKMRSGANPCDQVWKDADTCVGSAGCWIGLHEPEEEGRMEWTDGSDLDYANWFPDEPNGAGGAENEVEIRMGCDGYACFNGKWNDNRGINVLANNQDQSVAVEQPFICQGAARGGPSNFGGGH